MSNSLGVRRMCLGCKYGKQKWKSVYCTNEQSPFNGYKTNHVLCAPCFEPKEKEDGDNQ